MIPISKILVAKTHLNGDAVETMKKTDQNIKKNTIRNVLQMHKVFILHQRYYKYELLHSSKSIITLYIYLIFLITLRTVYGIPLFTINFNEGSKCLMINS